MRRRAGGREPDDGVGVVVRYHSLPGTKTAFLGGVFQSHVRVKFSFGCLG